MYHSMHTRFKQAVIEQYSSFKTREGFADVSAREPLSTALTEPLSTALTEPLSTALTEPLSTALTEPLSTALTKALELKRPANPSRVLKLQYCSTTSCLNAINTAMSHFQIMHACKILRHSYVPIRRAGAMVS